MKGGTIEDAAANIRKHSAKWSGDCQHRTVALLSKIYGTRPAHEKGRPKSPNDFSGLGADFLVPGVGLEPTLSFRKKGF